MDPLSLAVWFYFVVLVLLNTLDWFTTTIILVHWRRQGPKPGLLPLWKTTRFGKWCVRHGLCKPPVQGMVYWYDHELNPWVRRAMKRLGLHGVLSGIKIMPFVVLTFTIADNAAHAPDIALVGLTSILLFLNCLYIFVVASNSKVILKCLNAPYAVDG